MKQTKTKKATTATVHGVLLNRAHTNRRIIRALHTHSTTQSYLYLAQEKQTVILMDLHTSHTHRQGMFIYISKCRFTRYEIKPNGIKFNSKRSMKTNNNNNGNRSYKQNGNGDDKNTNTHTKKKQKIKQEIKECQIFGCFFSSSCCSFSFTLPLCHLGITVIRI